MLNACEVGDCQALKVEDSDCREFGFAEGGVSVGVEICGDVVQECRVREVRLIARYT